jgi:hypothetical protein
MHDAKERRDYRAGNDAEKHRNVSDKARAPTHQAEDHHEHEQRDGEPFKLPIAGIGKRAGHTVDHFGERRQAAAGPIDADPHQRDADD